MGEREIGSEEDLAKLHEDKRRAAGELPAEEAEQENDEATEDEDEGEDEE